MQHLVFCAENEKRPYRRIHMWVHRLLLQCKLFPSFLSAELVDNGISRN